MNPLEWAGLALGALVLINVVWVIGIWRATAAANHELILDELWDEDDDLPEAC